MQAALLSQKISVRTGAGSAARLPRAAGRRLSAIVELQLKLRTLQAPAWPCLALPGRRQRTQNGMALPGRLCPGGSGSRLWLALLLALGA